MKVTGWAAPPPASVAFIANPVQAAAVAIRKPDLKLPVWATRALAAGTVVAVDATAFVSGFGGIPEISTSEQATLHVSDSPVQIGTAGNPARGGVADGKPMADAPDRDPDHRGRCLHDARRGPGAGRRRRDVVTAMKHDAAEMEEHTARILARAEQNAGRLEAEIAEEKPRPKAPAPRLWQAPEKKAEPPGPTVPPAAAPRAAAAAAVVPAPLPPAKQGERVWALCSFAAGEAPSWRWLRLPEPDAITEALAKAFGEFTRAARLEVDGLRDGGDASRHNLVLRLQAAERRIDELEAKLAAPKAKR